MEPDRRSTSYRLGERLAYWLIITVLLIIWWIGLITVLGWIF